MVRDAEADAHAAHLRLTRARKLVDWAKGAEADGETLAKLALQGNTLAMRRLHEQVRTLHPGIVGFAPTPDANDDGWWRRPMHELALLIDFGNDADDAYLAGLAEAMLTFVRVYKPDRNHKDAKRQGMAMAYTRGGTLFFRMKKGHEAAFERIDPGHKDIRGSLLEVLAKVPALNVMAGLSEDGWRASFNVYTRYHDTRD